MSVLQEIIENNDGKVKIYLAANIAEKTVNKKVIQYGYQYIHNTFKTILPPEITGNDARS